MNKKTIAIIASLSFVVSNLYITNIYAQNPLNSEAVVYTESNVKYEYDVQNEEAVITKISSEQEVVRIPDTLGGYPVTRIGERAMSQGIIKVKKLVIPSEVIEIDDHAFSNLKYLTDVTLPDGLQSLGEECFSGCEKLEKMVIPDSVTSIGENCFWKCYSLTEAKLPDGITELNSTFSNCESLKSITIPETVTSMIGGTFAGCVNLEEVIWNSNAIEDISDMEFYNTKWINNYLEEYILTDNGENFYKYIGNEEEFEIPDGVKRIQYCAFQQSGNGKDNLDCTLKKVTVPASVTEIAEQAFYGAEKLETLVFKGEIEKIGKNAFRNCAFTEFTVPDSVKYINDGAFGRCEKLKKVSLPEGLETIGDECFAGCTSLSDIILPDSLTGIGVKVFKDCTSLKKINIPEGIVDNISKNTFYCFNIEKVDYNGEITNEIYSAVPGADWEANEIQNGDFVIIDNVLRAYNGDDKNIEIPDGVTEISTGAFKNKEIDTVAFPSSLEKIGETAFYASTIKEVTIPSTIKIVGEMSFAQCTNIERVVIEEGVQQVDGLAFAYCNKLDDVTIGAGVRVAQNAFDDTPYKQQTKSDTDEYSIEPTTSPDTVQDSEESPKLTVSSSDEEISVIIDDKPVIFTDAMPFIDENDRTQIPVRAVMESMGCEVSYDAKSQTVTVKSSDVDVTLKIGESVMNVGGEILNMDTAARIVNDRTYIPARFVAEVLGYEVEWE